MAHVTESSHQPHEVGAIIVPVSSQEETEAQRDMQGGLVVSRNPPSSAFRLSVFCSLCIISRVIFPKPVGVNNA